MDVLEPGDTVRLKSGSPNLGVVRVGDDAGTCTAWVTWMDGKLVREAAFPVVLLKKINPNAIYIG